MGEMPPPLIALSLARTRTRCRRRCRRRRCCRPPWRGMRRHRHAYRSPQAWTAPGTTRRGREAGRRAPSAELAPLCKPFGLLRRMRDHGPFKAAEFFHPRQKMRGVGLEGFRLRRYPRGDHRHGRRPPRLIACHPFSGFRASWRDGSPEIPARGCMRPYPSAHYARAQPRRWARSRRK